MAAIDRNLIGQLRTASSFDITIGGGNFAVHPDKRLAFELSVAFQSFLIRREKQLTNK